MLKGGTRRRGISFIVVLRRLKGALVIPLALVFLAAGCGGSEEREAKYVERGKALFEQGDLVKAGIEFRNALQINPKGIEARYHMGLISEREGNLQAAYRTFTAVATEQPDHFGAHLKLAQLYAIARQMESAEKEAEIAGTLKPDDPDLLSVRGTIAYVREDYAETKRLAQDALAVDPKHEGAHLLLAQALRASGAGVESFRQIDQAIALIPETVAIRLLKASVHLESDQLDQVHAVYEELFQLEPENPRYRASLAQIYISRGLSDEAEGVLRSAIDAGVGGDETKLNLIELIAATDGLEKAEAQLREFIAAEPDNHLFAFRLVSLYSQTGRPAEAGAVLRTVIDQAGMEQAGLDARAALARLLISEGDGAKASDLVVEVLETDPTNPDALLMRAAFSLEKGETEPAIADLRALLRDRPDTLPALRLLAQAQVARGDVALAMDTLKRVVDLDKSDVASRQRLAAHLAQSGNVSAALALLDEVLEIDPGSVPALQAKAGILIGQQRWAEAEAAVQKVLEMPDHQALGRTLYGGLNYAQGRYEEAIVAYEDAHRLAPTAVEPITGVTMAYLAQEAPQEAAVFLESVIAEDSTNAVARNLLGEIRLRQNKLQEAEQQFRLAIAARDDWAVPYLNLTRSLIARGELHEALALYQSALQKQPENVALQLALAEAQHKASDYTGSRSTYQAIIDKHADNVIAANNLAALLADHDYEDTESLRHALALATRFENSSNPYFIDTLGWVQFRMGDFRQARANLQRAVSLLPDNPQLQYHLGMVLARLGEHEGAVGALEKAVIDGADYPGIDEARAALADLQREKQQSLAGEESG
jgi:tetratricopeptide (TPR) repeat protein